MDLAEPTAGPLGAVGAGVAVAADQGAQVAAAVVGRLG